MATRLPNVILSGNSQVGNPKILEIGTLAILEVDNFLCRLWLRWGLKHSCSPHQELSKDMWHAIYTQVNRSNSHLLMGRNQIGNLISGLSFSNNLCFTYPSGSCEPILDIYIPRDFQWYKKLFNLINLPLQSPSKDLEVHQGSNS